MPGLFESIVIIARDEASPVFAKIGASARASQLQAVKGLEATNVALVRQIVKVQAARLAWVGFRNVLLAGAVTLGIAGFAFISLTKVVGEFQARMIRIAALGGPVFRQNLESLQDRIFELGKQFGITTDDIAMGTIELVKAGFSYQQVLEILIPTIQVATANQISFAVAAGIMTSAMLLFARDGTTAARAAEVLHLAAAEARLDFEQFDEILGFIGSSALVTGLRIEELAAFVAALSQAGIRGFAPVRTLFLRMIQRSDELEAAFRRIGVAVDVVTEDGKLNLTEIIRVLNEANLTTDQWKEIWTLLRIRSAAALTTGVVLGDEYNRILTLLTGNTNTLTSAAEQMAQSLTATLTAAKIAFFEALFTQEFTEDLAAIIKTQLVPALESVSPVIAKLAFLLTGEFAAILPTLVTSLGRFLEAFLQLLPIFLEFSKLFVFVLRLFTGLPPILQSSILFLLIFSKILPIRGIIELGRAIILLSPALRGMQVGLLGATQSAILLRTALAGVVLGGLGVILIFAGLSTESEDLRVAYFALAGVTIALGVAQAVLGVRSAFAAGRVALLATGESLLAAATTKRAAATLLATKFDFDAAVAQGALSTAESKAIVTTLARAKAQAIVAAVQAKGVITTGALAAVTAKQSGVETAMIALLSTKAGVRLFGLGVDKQAITTEIALTALKAKSLPLIFSQSELTRQAALSQAALNVAQRGGVISTSTLAASSPVLSAQMATLGTTTGLTAASFRGLALAIGAVSAAIVGGLFLYAALTTDSDELRTVYIALTAVTFGLAAAQAILAIRQSLLTARNAEAVGSEILLASAIGKRAAARAIASAADATGFGPMVALNAVRTKTLPLIFSQSELTARAALSQDALNLAQLRGAATSGTLGVGATVLSGKMVTLSATTNVATVSANRLKFALLGIGIAIGSLAVFAALTAGTTEMAAAFSVLSGVIWGAVAAQIAFGIASRAAIPFIGPIWAAAFAAIVVGAIAGIVTFVASQASRSFAHGIDFVPENMLAFLHRGERVVPAEQNTMDQRQGMFGGEVNVTIVQPGPGLIEELVMRFGR